MWGDILHEIFIKHYSFINIQTGVIVLYNMKDAFNTPAKHFYGKVK